MKNYKEYIIKGFLFLVLFLPLIFTFLYSSSLREGLFIKISYVFIYVILLLIPASFLKSKAYFIVTGILWLLFLPIEVSHLRTFNISANSGFISAVLQTDLTELSELLVSFKYEAALFVVVVLLYFYFLFRIKNDYLIKSKLRYLILPFFLISNIFLFFLMYAQQSSINDRSLKVSVALTNTFKKYRKIYPVNLFVAYKEYKDRMERIYSIDEKVEDFSFDSFSDADKEEKEIYVLIIGESARSSSFSLNGYGRHTNPNLDSISNIVSYKNAYSTATLTEKAMPLLLSRATPLSIDISYREKTLPELFKESGFFVSWIGNQSFNNPYIVRLADNSDYKYLSTVDFDSFNRYDGLMLPILDNVLNLNSKKTFIVIHTLGSHFRYNYRYPEEFEKFKPGIPDNFSYGEIGIDKKDMFINSYDNTILYTDFVVSEIIKSVEKRNCVSAVVYVSDHGENLYDCDKELFLHGSEVATEFELHIPLIMWFSDRYIEEYKDIYSNILEHRDSVVSTNNIFYTVSEIAHLKYRLFQPEMSISSSSFKEGENLSYIGADDKIYVNEFVK